MRRWIVAILLYGSGVMPMMASAQLPVIDTANLVQNTISAVQSIAMAIRSLSSPLSVIPRRSQCILPPTWPDRPPVSAALQQRIRAIAHDLVVQLAPDEVCFFEVISAAFFAHPRRLLRGPTRSTVLLGAGLGSGATYWTPVVLAATTAVLSLYAAPGDRPP
jgi:hypothetical protein